MAGNQPQQADPRPEFPGKRLRSGLRFLGSLIIPSILLFILVTIYNYVSPDFAGLTLEDVLESGLNVYQKNNLDNLKLSGSTLTVATVAFLAGLLVLRWRLPKKKNNVFLLDFEVYTPPAALNLTVDDFIGDSAKCGKFTPESIEFQSRLAKRSGLGDKTSLPPALRTEPPYEINMATAREEGEMVMFTIVEELLKRSGLAPKDIGVLIVNCSLFNPTPSLSAMIINHFKMRSDIISYNLAGMGCSAGVIAVSLAEEMLQVYPNKYALVVSTENITQNWYFGNERSMLIPNVLFRMGGAGILLTNKASDKKRSKYQLEHVTRVHLGADDQAYKCVYQKADKEGWIGVELKKDLINVAGKAMTKNMTRMGPHVLPLSEKIFFSMNVVAKKLFRLNVKTYTPDFKRAFNHFCLHAGGRAVIEGLGQKLELPKDKTDPSFGTLESYGNTSSSTIWYSLAYIETVQKVLKGDIVWQVGFGSGFKCNSAVWRALHPVRRVHKAWAHKLSENQKKNEVKEKTR